MNEKLDSVSATVAETVTLMQTTIQDVEEVSSLMLHIRESSQQVNQAMTLSAQDAEKLHGMTQAIHDDATQSADNAKQISEIDNELSAIVREMVSSLNGGLHAISNEELISSLKKAKEAHGNWMRNLKRIAEEMTIYPIQTDSHRCAFGHFYHSITIKHPDLLKDWTEIDPLHQQLHGMGDKMVAAVNANDRLQAQRLYNEADALSKQIFAKLDHVIQIIEQKSKAGEEVLRYA